MTKVDFSCRLVSKEDLNKLNVTLESLLKNNDKCVALMNWYHVTLPTIIKVIEKLNIPYREFFSYAPYSCGGNKVAVAQGIWSFKIRRSYRTEKRSTPIYITTASYDSIGWGKIAEELFKMKYPTLWKLFSYEKEMTYKYEKNMLADDFIRDNNLHGVPMEEVIKIFRKVKRGNNKVSIPKNHIKIYVQSTSHEHIYFEVTDNNSIYVDYDDLYRCLKGDFDTAWDNITNRKWYFDRVQGNEEWFNSPKTIELKNELKKISDNFNIKKFVKSLVD